MYLLYPLHLRSKLCPFVIHTLPCRYRTRSPGRSAFPLHPHNADIPSKFCLMIRSRTAFAKTRRQWRPRPSSEERSLDTHPSQLASASILGPVVTSPGQPRTEWEIRWPKTYGDIGTVLIQVPIWVIGSVLGEYTVEHASKVWRWVMYVRFPLLFLLSRTLYAPCVLYSR